MTANKTASILLVTEDANLNHRIEKLAEEAGVDLITLEPDKNVVLNVLVKEPDVVLLDLDSCSEVLIEDVFKRKDEHRSVMFVGEGRRSKKGGYRWDGKEVVNLNHLEKDAHKFVDKAVVNFVSKQSKLMSSLLNHTATYIESAIREIKVL